MRIVSAISAAPRRSPQRARLFHEMHARLAAASGPVIAQWRQRLEEATTREREENSLFDRELFYAIQPRQRLADLIQHYRNALA
jgi:hypothetical protein